jgi:hypothetical protein
MRSPLSSRRKEPSICQQIIMVLGGWPLSRNNRFWISKNLFPSIITFPLLSLLSPLDAVATLVTAVTKLNVVMESLQMAPPDCCDQTQCAGKLPSGSLIIVHKAAIGGSHTSLTVALV